MSTRRHLLRIGLGLFISLLAVLFLLHPDDIGNERGVRSKSRIQQKPSLEITAGLSKPIVPTELPRSTKVNHENLELKLLGIRKVLRTHENAQKQVISRVDDDKISHLGLVLYPPPPEMVEDIRKDFSPIAEIVRGSHEQKDPLSKLCVEIEDMLSYGHSEVTKEDFQLRILVVDVLPGPDTPARGSITSAVEAQWGTNDTGVPWRRTVGTSQTEESSGEKFESRYGHLFTVKEE